MQSIRNRITALTVTVVLIVVIISSGIAVFSLRLQEDVGSDRFVSLLCETNSDHINEQLYAIEQSVDTAASFVHDSISFQALAKGGVVGATGSGISLRQHDYASAGQREFDEFIKGHIAEVESVFHSTAIQEEYALSYYYRINPEISRATKGFLNSRVKGADYLPMEPTDLSAYPSNDYVHVGWYYLPIERGRPSWIEPYLDSSQQVEVVSFIAPLYKANTFIGVVGMDIAYDSLVSQIADLDVLESGYAFLTDEHGTIVYHPTLPRKMSLSDVNAELEAAQTSTDESKLISYTFEGIQKKAAWKTLSNGMRLFICAPVSEINAVSSGIMLLMVVVAGIVIALLIIAVMIGTRRITKPLEDLTEAATQIAEGNYDVSLTYDKNDEVGILTNSFRHLVDNVRIRIADLSSRAYKDALTGVKNKAAYDVYVAEIEEAMRNGQRKPFAVAAFDCNELKHINDTYGHEKGDAYLCNSCQAICKVYVHSPVFRVGGDEFSCILTDDDYNKRDELEAIFWENMKSTAEAASEEWEAVNLAMGMAVFDVRRDRSVLDVARRADDLMYQNKKEYKASCQ